MARLIKNNLQIALATGAAFLALAAAPVAAQARANISVPGQALEKSLKQVAAQSRTNILFTGVKVNEPIPASKFKFDIPKGADVIQE